ncbi:hypothetical protein [Undibacterium squillarum]|uniref:hypothetical protein n=1 Tax=Undibacterium squillarum TaxID=1131567 RepID=UPI0035B12F2E
MRRKISPTRLICRIAFVRQLNAEPIFRVSPTFQGLVKLQKKKQIYGPRLLFYGRKISKKSPQVLKKDAD